MSESPARERRRALVVENTDDTREVVLTELSMRGVGAVGARGCAEALELMKSENFAAAVVDLGMPGVDGLNCAGRMKLLDPGVTLFAFTAYPEAARPEFILKDAGFAKCFRKGGDEEELYDAVGGAVRAHETAATS